MRTYDAATYRSAREAWSDFGPEWNEVRRLSWDRGYPYPPSGTRWDDRDDPEPSQRAIVYRALIDRPKDTVAIVARSHSWSQVVSGILQTEGRIREDAALLDRESDLEREERPSHREAVMSIADILARIEASR